MKISPQNFSDLPVPPGNYDTQRPRAASARLVGFHRIFQNSHGRASLQCFPNSKSALNLPCRFRRPARVRRATAMDRNVPVTRTQNLHHPGNPGQPSQRPRPPNLPRQCHRNIRSPKLLPVRKQKSHLAQQLLARHAEQSANARILQRRDRQSAPLQNRRQPSRNPRAKRALRVKKQPPPRVPPLPICNFRCQRNHFCRTDTPVCLLSFLLSESQRTLRLCVIFSLLLFFFMRSAVSCWRPSCSAMSPPYLAAFPRP